MTKNKKLILKLVLTALFAALSYVGVMIQIPMPTGGMVHLGNFFCVIGALLIGGLYGGFAGALGMGLYDIIHYNPASATRTIICKFLMGFLAGYLFRLLVTKKLNIKTFNYVITTVVFLFFGVSLAGYITGPWEIGSKSMSFHWFIPTILGAGAVLYLFVAIFTHKLPKIASYALGATSVGIFANIFGETILKAFIYALLNSTKYPTLDAAFAYSITSLPSTLLTSIVTMIFIAIIFYPVYKAVIHIPATKDLLPKLDEDIVSDVETATEQDNAEATE